MANPVFQAHNICPSFQKLYYQSKRERKIKIYLTKTRKVEYAIELLLTFFIPIAASADPVRMVLIIKYNKIFYEYKFNNMI